MRRLVVAPRQKRQRKEDTERRDLRHQSAEPLGCASAASQVSAQAWNEPRNGAQIGLVRLAQLGGEESFFAENKSK